MDTCSASPGMTWVLIPSATIYTLQIEFCAQE